MEINFGEEKIKVIKDFPNYGISNLGYVYKDLKYGLLPETYKENRLKGYKDKKGFLKVHLSNGKKSKVFFIHRLVAEYFVDNPENYKYVRHIDGNKDNNRAENLEWTPTLKEKKIDKEKVLKIYKLKEEGKSLKEISDEVGLSYSTVSNILSNQRLLTVRIPDFLMEKLIEVSLKKGVNISSFIQNLLKKELVDER
ncbi:HNH endonuclease [Persephonella sp.]